MPEVFNIDDIERSAAHIKTNANARIVSSVMEPAGKAFSSEMARMGACLLWVMSDTAHYRTAFGKSTRSL